MYNKEELLSKNAVELEEIAKEFDVPFSDSVTQEDMVYAILDKQAVVEANKAGAGSKRKRVRIVKKDTDRVYTVNGTDGENFDLMKNNKQAEHSRTAASADDEVEDETETESAEDNDLQKAISEAEQILSQFPKHRGRKSKAELMAIEEAKKKLAVLDDETRDRILEGFEEKQDADDAAVKTDDDITDNNNVEEPAPAKSLFDELNSIEDNSETEPADDGNSFVPEAMFASGESSSETTNLIAQLQAKANLHNERAEEARENNNYAVWEGDPGDSSRSSRPGHLSHLGSVNVEFRRVNRSWRGWFTS